MLGLSGLTKRFTRNHAIKRDRIPIYKSLNENLEAHRLGMAKNAGLKQKNNPPGFFK